MRATAPYSRISGEQFMVDWPANWRGLQALIKRGGYVGMDCQDTRLALLRRLMMD